MNRKKVVGAVAVVLMTASLIVASLSYKPTSGSRRGKSIEGLWHGFLVVFGVESSREAAQVWAGRVLFAGFLVALGFWIHMTVKERRVRDDVGT